MMSTPNQWWSEDYPHLPVNLVRAMDVIAGRLCKPQWLGQCLTAIQGKARLQDIWPEFARWLLLDPQFGVIKYVHPREEGNAIRHVAALYAQDLRFVDAGQWCQAADKANELAAQATSAAARDALLTAADAALAATVLSWDDTNPAFAAAARTPNNAAMAAASAAVDAADPMERTSAHVNTMAAAYEQMAAKLLELLQAA